MNRMFKVGISALALVAASSASALSKATEPVNDSLAEDEGVVGWTPVAIGLATPVQLPWGINSWNVYGLDLNVFYSDAPNMYGLCIGGLGATTRETMVGLQVGGLVNYAFGDVYGMRATLGANICNGSAYGIEAGAFGMHRDFYGFEAELLGCLQDECNGIQIGGLATVSLQKSHGVNIAGLANFAKVAHGFQCSAIFNMTEELHGCQLALVNFARTCPWGFQIGLVNIILDNQIKVLPFFNAYF